MDATNSACNCNVNGYYSCGTALGCRFRPPSRICFFVLVFVCCAFTGDVCISVMFIWHSYMYIRTLYVIYVRTYIYTYIYIYLYTYVYIYIRIYIRTYLLHVCMIFRAVAQVRFMAQEECSGPWYCSVDQRVCLVLKICVTGTHVACWHAICISAGCVYIYIYIYTYVRTYIYVSIYIYVRMYVYWSICEYVRTYVRTYIYVYVYIDIRIRYSIQLPMHECVI